MGVDVKKKQYIIGVIVFLIYSVVVYQATSAVVGLLKERELEYEEIDIEEKGWSRDDLFELTGGRTVPQIMIDDNPIGGYDDLVQFL